jgi:hypothetical protein
VAQNQQLNALAQQAGLTQQQKDQIAGLSKLLDSHQSLMSMPSDVASQEFNKKTPDQQKAHTSFFSGDNPLGNALHYVTSAAKTIIAAPFKALNEVSDFSTRLYRTAAISMDQGVDLGAAFKIANDKGDKVFSPGRITDAEGKFGKDMMSVAVKIASGDSLASIQANGTDAEKLIASTAVQLQESGKNDLLLQDAIDAAQAAKYSPGRQLANLLLPGSMEGSGFLYKGISGIGDASFRIFLDPTLVFGKAKKAVDAGEWVLFNILGKEKYSYGRSLLGTVNNPERVDRVFQDTRVVNFFDTYGAKLDELSNARKSGNNQAGAKISAELTRIAPEFGPATQSELIAAGVKNAETAKGYLKNVDVTAAILRGQTGRKTALIPILDTSRKVRISILTTGNKVLDIDKVGSALIKAYYGLDTKTEDIVQGLNAKSEMIAAGEKSVGKLRQSGSFVFTNNQIRGRIDRFAAKFAITPYFKEDFFDFNALDSSDKIYQLARLGMTRYHARVIKEAFSAGNEGQKRQIFDGLWDTMAEIKGWNKASIGQKIIRDARTKPEMYAASIPRKVIDPVTGAKTTELFNPAAIGPDGEQMAILDWQLSSGISVPKMSALNAAVAKEALLSRKFGINYKKWIEDGTNFWSWGTLAGPRTVIRNAGEDLLLHGLIGESPFAAIAGRRFMTRLAKADPEAKASMIARITSKIDRPEVTAQIEKALKSGDSNDFQTIVATQLVKNSLGSVLDEAAYKRMANHFKYGNKESLNSAVSDGARNAQNGGNYATSVTKDVSFYGAHNRQELELDGIKWEKATGVAYGLIDPTVSQASRISWLFSLATNANSDLGALAFRYMKPGMEEATRRKIAIEGITAYLEKLPEKAYGRFGLAAVGVDKQTHAAAIYDSVRAIVSKLDGSLNDELVSKIRTVDKDGNILINAKELSLDDLPSIGKYNDAPKYISGPTFIPSTGQNFTAGFINSTWDLMAKGNAELSRKPMAHYELNQVLKIMDESGFRKNQIDRATKGLTDEAKILAETNAEKQLAAIAEDIAANRVLSYVDNPDVRSQLAMSVRNFARFYRATEDFYRRAVRSVRYNPESLARASLTYEGIIHSGWIHTDESGDQYFFYPGLSPVYRVMDKVAKAFGVNSGFQTGLPIEFSAKLKMITPSMNPDSLFPTFAGPAAAFPVKMVGNLVPQFKELEQYLTGNYGQDQPMISALLPAHLNRFLQTLNKDERNGQYASAFRKAATYVEASGQGLKTTIGPDGVEIPPSPGDIAEYQQKLQGASTTVLALRFLFGFFAPASPSVTLKSDMAGWARDNGTVSYKAAFNQLIEQYHGDIDKATGEWIKYYPNQVPYTVAESESTVVANVRAVDKATSWLTENQDLLSRYPQAAAFLIPQAGTFSFDTYRLLSQSGLKQNKSLEEFTRQVSVAKDQQTYFDTKSEYDKKLVMAFSTDSKRRIRDEWQMWADEFKGARPLLQIQLAKSASNQVERVQALDDLRNMLNDTSVTTEARTRKALKEMLNEYDSYVSQRDRAASPGSSFSASYKDNLDVNAQNRIKSIASGNANAEAAFNSLFAPLFR